MNEWLSRCGVRQVCLFHLGIGYLITLIWLTMTFASIGQLIQFTILPLIIAFIVVEKTLLRKILSSTRQGQFVFWSVIAAIAVSSLTSVLSIIFSAVWSFVTGDPSVLYKLPEYTVYYLFAGLIYCCPGVLIGGYFLGCALYKKSLAGQQSKT